MVGQPIVLQRVPRPHFGRQGGAGKNGVPPRRFSLLHQRGRGPTVVGRSSTRARLLHRTRRRPAVRVLRVLRVGKVGMSLANVLPHTIVLLYHGVFRSFGQMISIVSDEIRGRKGPGTLLLLLLLPLLPHGTKRFLQFLLFVVSSFSFLPFFGSFIELFWIMHTNVKSQKLTGHAPECVGTAPPRAELRRHGPLGTVLFHQRNVTQQSARGFRECGGVVVVVTPCCWSFLSSFGLDR